MCGSSSEQNENYQEQADFAQQMVAENSTVFGQQQSILSNLNAGFSKIIAAGPSQNGFSADEMNTLNTSADEAVGKANTKASQELGDMQAAQGGGDTFIPSGVKGAQDEELAQAGLTADASTKSQILQAGYTQGNTNYNNAVAGEEGVASDLSPTSYAGATTSSQTGAGNEANQIAASANSPFTAVMGALGGVAGAATGQILKNAGTGCWIAAEIFGGWNEPRTVLVRNWIFGPFAETFHGGLLAALYEEHGEWMSDQVRRFRPVRWIFTKIFNHALRKAQKAAR